MGGIKYDLGKGIRFSNIFKIEEERCCGRGRVVNVKVTN